MQLQWNFRVRLKGWAITIAIEKLKAEGYLKEYMYEFQYDFQMKFYYLEKLIADEMRVSVPFIKNNENLKK